MADIDPLAHICSGWCNHPDVPTVIVTLAYLDQLRAAGVTLDPRPAPDAALREAAQAFMDQEVDWIGDRPYYIYAGRPPIAILAALRAALAPADREEEL